MYYSTYLRALCLISKGPGQDIQIWAEKNEQRQATNS